MGFVFSASAMDLLLMDGDHLEADGGRREAASATTPPIHGHMSAAANLDRDRNREISSSLICYSITSKTKTNVDSSDLKNE